MLIIPNTSEEFLKTEINFSKIIDKKNIFIRCFRQVNLESVISEKLLLYKNISNCN